MKDINLVSTVTAAADVTSAAFDLGDLQDFAIEVEFSGGAGNLVGVLTMECRNKTTAAWKTVSSSSQNVTASADHIWNVIGAGYRYVRVFWDYTSGTGNIKVDLIAKENVIIGA